MKTHTSALLGLLVAILVHQSQGFEWRKCGEGSFAVKDVLLSPDTISPGCNAEFKIEADSSVDVQQGTVGMTVTYGGIPIWMQSDDLCTKTLCPVHKGAVAVEYQQPFPVFTPPGRYTVTLRGATGTSMLFCVAVDFEVVPPGDVAGVAAAGLEAVANKLLHTHRKELE